VREPKPIKHQDALDLASFFEQMNLVPPLQDARWKLPPQKNKLSLNTAKTIRFFSLLHRLRTRIALLDFFRLRSIGIFWGFVFKLRRGLNQLEIALYNSEDFVLQHSEMLAVWVTCKPTQSLLIFLEPQVMSIVSSREVGKRVFIFVTPISDLQVRTSSESGPTFGATID
jgi:hypothetical protein